MTCNTNNIKLYCLLLFSFVNFKCCKIVNVWTRRRKIITFFKFEFHIYSHNFAADAERKRIFLSYFEPKTFLDMFLRDTELISKNLEKIIIVRGIIKLFDINLIAITLLSLKKRKMKKGKYELISYYNDLFKIRPKKPPQTPQDTRKSGLDVRRCSTFFLELPSKTNFLPYSN